MTAYNVVNPEGSIGRPTPVENKYAYGATDSTTATATLTDIPAVPDKQHAVYGFIIANTGAAAGKFIIGSVNNPILTVTLPAGVSRYYLAPEGLGPLCIAETNKILRLFNVKVGAGTTMEIHVIYRTI